jgi:hypothetical protein
VLVASTPLPLAVVLATASSAAVLAVRPAACACPAGRLTAASPASMAAMTSTLVLFNNRHLMLNDFINVLLLFDASYPVDAPFCWAKCNKKYQVKKPGCFNAIHSQTTRVVQSPDDNKLPLERLAGRRNAVRMTVMRA